jgi:5-methylthioribose kinase
MEQEPYISFPGRVSLRKRSQQLQKGTGEERNYPPLVHIRNDGGAGEVSDHTMHHYLKDLLGFNGNQKDELGLLKKALMETTEDPKKRGRRRRKRRKTKAISDASVVPVTTEVIEEEEEELTEEASGVI